jgi:hypothetical protein
MSEIQHKSSWRLVTVVVERPVTGATPHRSGDVRNYHIRLLSYMFTRAGRAFTRYKIHRTFVP